MGTPTKILAFAGSTRTESFNKKLSRAAAEAARQAGAEVTWIDLRNYPMPLFDGDFEDAEGLPENARRLKKLFLEHDALLISTPEYNSSLPGVLKNALDWVSRQETDDEKPLTAFTGKVAALFSASPGALGGLRSMTALRAMLENITVLVIPQQLAVGAAHEAFDDKGALKDAKKAAQVAKIARALVTTTAKLKAD